MAKDPSASAQKWARNLAASTPTIQAGVQGVTVAPNAKAAAAAASYAQNTAASVASGRYQAANNAVGVEGWRQPMLSKGLQRIATGAQQAQPVVQQYQAFQASTADAIKNKVAQMPRGGRENALARVAVAIDGMLALKGKFKKSQ